MTEKLRLSTIPLAGIIEENVITAVSIATTGEAIGHRLLFDLKSLEQLQALGRASLSGIKSRFTHPDWFHDGLGKYLGRMKNFRIEGEKLVGDLHISVSAKTSPAGNIGQYILDLAREDPLALGVSVVIDLDRVWPTDTGQEVPVVEGKPSNALTKYPVARPTHLYAADLVDEPALNPDGLFNYHNIRDFLSAYERDGLNQITEGVLQEMEEEVIQTRLSKLEASFEKLNKSLEDGVIQIGNQPPRGQQLSMSPNGMEQFQGYFDWLFGAPGAKLPPPELRRADALYRAVTDDADMKGVFAPDRVALAAATTTTLADLAVNAMNKVVLDLYPNLTAYRWFELITSVQPTDGSLQDMQWLQMGGVGALPVVAEGAAYTELDVTDTKETSSFTKYGGYVGITDKMLRNSQIDRLQAIPRALTISAIRTRSAAIAAIFTQASGTGPTLAQDSTVLFHANHGSNVQTTAFSIAAWKAARLECAKMAELGSAKRQILWPKFCLVPVDLFDTALVAFGYGQGPGGYPGTTNNDVNPYAQDRAGDPRPIVVAVPEWTDTSDWAYIVDPQISPVICMSYGDNPGGRSHPAPQLYRVTDPTSGLLFTNDTLPIKVRDIWAYGVATWRGIGKRNVA
jgi:HK97 family phage major capsid protein